MMILAINSGSSSLKCAAVDPETGKAHFAAVAERLGATGARYRVTEPEASSWCDLDDATHEVAFSAVLERLGAHEAIWDQIAGVGHRVVHGGEHFSRSQRIDEDVCAAIEECASLAPLHNPANLLGIQAARQALPDLVHVAVFDTAFHQTMPEMAYRYAVPESWYTDHHVRRYGFHGSSHRYVSSRAAEVLDANPESVNVLTAHLGNGCSLAAVAGGKCVDTTMGLTPLEGLVMGTRSGDVDPGLVFFMHDHAKMDISRIKTALNQYSGLLGLSGWTNDMRELSEAAAENPHAQLAIDVFCHRLAKSIGALATNFSRLDALVFTGGIGENSALVRATVCDRLRGLGIRIVRAANDSHQTKIHAEESSTSVLVLPTNEELLIARDTAEFVST